MSYSAKLSAANLRVRELEQERDKLRTSIEDNWNRQAGDHACGCDEWPECTHTIAAHEMRAAPAKDLRGPIIEVQAAQISMLQAQLAAVTRERDTLKAKCQKQLA